MKKRNRGRIYRAAALALSAIVTAGSIFSCIPAPAAYAAVSSESVRDGVGEISITARSSGYAEGAYAEWNLVEGAASYEAYVSTTSGNAAVWTKLDDELLREYKYYKDDTDTTIYGYYMRADAVGLKAGSCYFKIVAKNAAGAAIAEKITGKCTVTAHDRSGFAWKDGTASGAYNEDGTLKSDAVVLYVTEDTKDTVTTTVKLKNGTTKEYTGLNNIIKAYKNQDKAAPLNVRFIGKISDPAGISTNSSKGDLYLDELLVGATFEGIGEDATLSGFGLVLRNCKNVEIRNIGVILTDSTELDCIGLSQGDDYVWVHNCDFFYGTQGKDSDQKKGDGSLDCKLSDHVTFSYNHFWDSGKCCLLGNSSDINSNSYKGLDNHNATYHHNWFDHSDSRHPRARYFNAHVYNNYYDGNSKYGIGATMGASVFSENNYFRNCTNPMLISKQGTDVKGGTFSGEEGGIIKAYGNVMTGKYTYAKYSESNTLQFDAYEVAGRSETVPDTVKTLSGNHVYDNFDTAEGFYSYTPDKAEDVPEIVKASAGRLGGGDLKFEFTDADDTLDAVNTSLKTVLTNYVANGGNTISDGPVPSVNNVFTPVITEEGSGNDPEDPKDPENPGNDEQQTVYYTVSFNSLGAVVSSNKVVSGNTVSAPSAPAREGYEFEGWYTSQAAADALNESAKYDFASKVEADLTLYAGWKSVSEDDGKNEEESTEDSYDHSGDKEIADASGNAVTYELEDTVFYYTGTAVKPAVKLYGNGRLLSEGVDYTLKYSNNKLASADADGKALAGVLKAPSITVSGKGNYRGKFVITFNIRQRSLSDSEVAYSDAVVADVTKAVPKMSCHGVNLKNNKDFTYALKGSVLEVKGQGNYCGTLNIPVNVKSDSKAVGKISISVEKKTYAYDGKAHDASADKIVTVKDASGNILKAGSDYVIVLTDNINAGTMKITVCGRGDYAGLLTKKLKITPAQITPAVSGIAASYTYAYGGVYPEPVVKSGSTVLTKGVDYKLSYSKNKAAGTAAVKVTLTGNYKGTVTKNFEIKPASLSGDTFRALAPDQVSNGNNGTYYSKPYVELDHVLIKASEYSCSYYTDAACKKEITKQSPLTVASSPVTVYVKITGKGKNYTGTAPVISYKVYPAGKASLAKAAVTLKDSTGNKLKTMSFTGKLLKPAKAEVTLSGSPVSSGYTVSCFGNVYKGMAVAVVSGDGKTYAGSKAAKYSVKAGDIETLTKSE